MPISLSFASSSILLGGVFLVAGAAKRAQVGAVVGSAIAVSPNVVDVGGRTTAHFAGRLFP